MYILTDGESVIEIIAFVLNIVNHRDYDKLFGYNKHRFSRAFYVPKNFGPIR